MLTTLRTPVQYTISRHTGGLGYVNTNGEVQD